MGINIEGNQHFLTNLNVEAGQTVGTKHFKDHLLRILLVGFDNKTFHFPFTSSRRTASFGSLGNHSSL